MKMSDFQSASLVLLFITVLSNKGISIPTSRPLSCSPEEPLIFKHGDTLQLECGSYCSGPAMDDSSMQFKWSKRVIASDNTIELEMTTGPVFTKEGAIFRDGGEYTCLCADGGSPCSYLVSVIPTMTFETSDTFVHVGDVFELTCTLTGYPSNFTRISSKKSGTQLRDQIQKRINDTSTRSYIAVFEPEGNDYVCEAESYFAGELVGKFREEITVNVYIPPTIVYTTEFIISNERDFGKTGQLVCTVQQSPDIDSYVSWFTKGNELSNSTKYSVVTLSNEDEEIVRYQLVVSNLEESDIGSYLCSLSTPFGVEDVQEAWIQVDYRRDTEAVGEHGSTHAHRMEGTTFAGPTSGQSNVVFFALCGMSVLVAMTVLWKITRGERPSHKAQHSSAPQIQYHHGNEGIPALNIPHPTIRKHC